MQLLHQDFTISAEFEESKRGERFEDIPHSSPFLGCMKHIRCVDNSNEEHFRKQYSIEHLLWSWVTNHHIPWSSLKPNSESGNQLHWLILILCFWRFWIGLKSRPAASVWGRMKQRGSLEGQGRQCLVACAMTLPVLGRYCACCFYSIVWCCACDLLVLLVHH